MQRPSRLLVPALAGITLLTTATQAFAQDYSGAGSDAIGFGLLACWGLFVLLGLAFFAFNVWMLIDAVGRQEYEYPGSTGNSKNLWVILLAVGFFVGFGWLVAIIYYLQIFKKVKRGTVAPEWAQGTAPAPQGYAPPPPPAAPPVAPPPPAAPPAVDSPAPDVDPPAEPPIL